MRAVLSQLCRTKSMSAARLRHHLPDTVDVASILALADEFPMLVRRVAGSAPSLAVVWPRHHDSRCPRVSVSKSSTHAKKCICGLLAVSAITSTGVHDSARDGDLGPGSAQ